MGTTLASISLQFSPWPHAATGLTVETKLMFQPWLLGEVSSSHPSWRHRAASPHNDNAINPRRKVSHNSCNFPSTAQPSCKCSLRAPKGGRSAGYTTLSCTKEIIANVFAGDAIFTQECQISFLQHFFFSFCQTLIISPPVYHSYPILPACLIQLIFSQSKYESTKKSIYHASESSLLFLLWFCNGGLHTPVRLLKPCPELQSAFVFTYPREDVSYICYVRPLTPQMCVCVCAGIPHTCVHSCILGPLVIPRVGVHWGLCLSVFIALGACCLLTTRKADE